MKFYSSSKKQDDQFTEHDKIIIVLGACGAGKTHFINTAVGNTVLEVGDDLKIKTRVLQHARFHHEELGDVVLVDTPALPEPDSHAMTPEQIERALEKWLDNAGKTIYGSKMNKRARVTGVIYLHRITDNKLTDRAFLHRGMLNALCGKEYAKRTALVTTMWESQGLGDQRDQAPNPPTTSVKKEQREVQIKEKHWSLMEMGGAPPMHRHDGSHQSALEVVKALIERDAVDQPIILVLSHNHDEQLQFIRNLAEASDIQFDPSSQKHTILKNVPVTKKTDSPLPDQEGDEPNLPQAVDTVHVAVISLPSIEHPHCASEIKRLHRIHGRDIIAVLYLSSAQTGTVPTVLDEVPNLHRNVVIASKIEGPDSSNKPELVKDGIEDGTSQVAFIQRWEEWARDFKPEAGALGPAPVLTYSAGLEGEIGVVSTIWELHSATTVKG